jgi:hypothetical protein
MGSGQVCIIHLGYSSAAIALASNDHDAFIVQRVLLVRSVHQLGERRMALDNHRWVQLDLQLLAEFRHALRLVLPAAVGEQNERNAVVFQ